MDKFQVLVRLILEQNIERTWISYDGGDKTQSGYGNIGLEFLRMDGELDQITLNIQNGKIRISDVIDEDFIP